MLESVLYYPPAFIYLESVDNNYKYCPTEEEWGKVAKIADFLEEFYKSTCNFSGTDYPTSNIFFPEVFLIEHHLKRASQDDDPFIKSMAEVMNEKFKKYWDDYNPLLALACVLDPRHTMRFVKLAYTKLHGEHSEQYQMIEATLRSLYAEYESKWKSQGSPSASVAPTEIARRARPYSRASMFEEFDSFEGGESTNNPLKSQLDLYLEEPSVSRNVDLDVLSFWRTNECRFPILASMARDALAVPVSTVASESAFSVGGRILDEFRSALKPENVEALVCT